MKKLVVSMFLFFLFFAVVVSCNKAPSVPTAAASSVKNYIIPLEYIEEHGFSKELKSLNLKPEEHSKLLLKKNGVFSWFKPLGDTEPRVQIGKGCITVTLCGSNGCHGFFFSDVKYN